MTLFTETGTGLRNDGWIRRDSAATTVPIKASANSFPFINDWNEDGRKDLLTGSESYMPGLTGNVVVFLNIGTNNAPRFANATAILAGGTPIYYYRSNPVVYDLDRDNLKDIIVGNDNGCLYFFKNIGTNAAPVFAAARETLKLTNGTVIDAYYGSRPHFVDWRGDGDLDLLLSGYYGYIDLYENAAVGAAEGKIDVPVAQEFKLTPDIVRGKVVFSYCLTRPIDVRIDVYSADGRLVATPVHRYEQTGAHSLSWSAQVLPAGVYMVRLEAGSTSSARMVVVH
jgi:hypothetical protein